MTDNVTELRSVPNRAAPRARNEPIDWSTFWQEERPVTWQVRDICEPGQSIAIYSKAGQGKSFLSLEIATGLATGAELLGSGRGEKLRVLYLDAENSPEDLKGRLQAYGYGAADDLSRLTYIPYPSLPPLDTEQGGKELWALCEQHRPHVVVFDTLTRYLAGRENDSDTYLAAYRHSFMRLKQADISQIRLDHMGKNAEQGQRGSSAKDADVDAVFRLSVEGRLVKLTREKSRTGRGPERIEYIRDGSPVRHVPQEPRMFLIADKVAECVKALDDLAVGLDVGRPTVIRLLSEAGYRYRAETVSEAIKLRRQDPKPVPGTAPEIAKHEHQLVI